MLLRVTIILKNVLTYVYWLLLNHGRKRIDIGLKFYRLHRGCENQETDTLPRNALF